MPPDFPRQMEELLRWMELFVDQWQGDGAFRQSAGLQDIFALGKVFERPHQCVQSANA